MDMSKKSYWQRVKDWFRKDENKVAEDNSETFRNETTETTADCIR